MGSDIIGITYYRKKTYRFVQYKPRSYIDGMASIDLPSVADEARVRPLSQSWPLFVGVGLGLALGSFEGAGVQAIFPYVAGGLATSSDHALWTLTYFIVNWSLGITLMPWTTARFGMRRVFLTATGVAAAGSVISGMTHNLWIMLLSRTLEGLAAGLLVPLSQSLFLRHSPKSKHALVTVFWSNAMLVPFFFGPAIGGWLATGPGFRWIFWLSLPLWLLAAVLGGRAIPADGGDPSLPAFDLAGFVLLYAGLMGLQITLDNGEQYGWWHSPLILSSSVFALIAFVLFAWRESEAPYPLLRFHYLRQRNYWLGLSLLCLGWAMFMGWAAALPLWVEQNLGYNGYWGSIVLVPIAIGAIPVSMVMDRLRSLVGLRRLATLCFLLFAASYGNFTLSPISSLGDTVLPMLFMGLAVGSLFVPLTLIMLSEVPAAEIPRAATTSNFIRVFSANIGVSLISVYWTRGSALVATQMRDKIDPYTHSIWPLWQLQHLLEVEAATLSMNNLLRLCMWIALLAALAAYLFIIPPRSIARPDGPHDYVEEEELETAETPAGGELPASTTS